MHHSSKHRPFSRNCLARSLSTLPLLGILVGCSGSSSSSDNVTPNSPSSDEQGQPGSESGGVQVDESVPEETLSPQDEQTGSGELLPVVFPTQTDLDLSYANEGRQLIEQISDAFILPNDIDVVFADCGIANAFFAAAGSLPDNFIDGGSFSQSSGGTILMCHELTQQFSDFYNEKEQAVQASNFVLLHELGHALVDQLQLPVLGIEESYVDGVAAVLLGIAGKSEGSVLAGWFFGSQPETPFFDTHRAGPQRLGDLACWGVGADMSLLDDPIIASISQQLMEGGRNCAGEYNQQLDALNTVLGPHIRGSLSEIFDDTLS